MNLLYIPILLISICDTLHVQALKKVQCAITDAGCINRGKNIMYQQLMAGNPDIGVPSSDPIRVDLIQSVTPALNFTLTDVYIHGAKECQADKLELLLNNLTWHFYITCPRLTVEANCYILGDIDSTHLQREGNCTITYGDYGIDFLGTLKRFTDSKGDSHVQTVSFVLDLDFKGSVSYTFHNLINGNDKKSETANEIINKNWKHINDATQEAIMNSFMGKMIESANKYVKVINVRDMFYEYI